MNNKKIKIILMLAAMFFLAAGEAGAVYKPHSRLLLKNTAFSRSKPQGFGRLDRAGEQGIKKGEDVFLYMEVYNCRSSRPGKEYELNLVMDMDIYYENGQCVYSQKDVKSFSPKSIRDFTNSSI